MNTIKRKFGKTRYLFAERIFHAQPLAHESFQDKTIEEIEIEIDLFIKKGWIDRPFMDSVVQAHIDNRPMLISLSKKGQWKSVYGDRGQSQSSYNRQAVGVGKKMALGSARSFKKDNWGKKFF